MKIICSLVVLVASVLIGAVAATNLQQVYAPTDASDYAIWRKTTHEFEKNVINGIWNPGDTPPVRELLAAYVDDVNRIFLGGPDTIPGLLETYSQNVLRLFDSPPPEGDKQLVKDFRGLTHDFEKAVIDALKPPPDSN